LEEVWLMRPAIFGAIMRAAIADGEGETQLMKMESWRGELMKLKLGRESFDGTKRRMEGEKSEWEQS